MSNSVSIRRWLPPWGAVFFSFLIPGLGQALARSVKAGLLWFLIFAIGLVFVMWSAISPSFAGFKMAGIACGALAILWLGMLVHAHRSAINPDDPKTNKPWIAALLSCLYPGIGQFYNRQVFEGVAFIGTAIVSEFLPRLAGCPVYFVIGVWAILNAFGAARHRAGLANGGMRLLLLTIVGSLAPAIGTALFLTAVAVQPFKLSTGAMAPTLLGIRTLPSGEIKQGDRMLVDKLTYKFRNPRRGEIVVFRTDNIEPLPAEFRSKYFVKRVVGLPGEHVSIKPPHLYINDQKVIEPRIFATISNRENGFSGFLLPGDGRLLSGKTDVVSLGEDEYFVLGDNQHASLDGRYWGPVQRKDIVGRVTKIYWPPDRAGITFFE
jgi:signal peptidase I